MCPASSKTNSQVLKIRLPSITWALGRPTWRSGPRLHCLNANGAELLQKAMEAEESQVAIGSDDDCEGQELTSEPPLLIPALAGSGLDAHATQLASGGNAPVIGEAKHIPPSTSRTGVISPDRRRRNAAAGRRKQKKRVISATSPYEGRSSKTRSENIKKLEVIARSSMVFALKDVPAAGPGSFVGCKITSARRSKPDSPGDLIERGFEEEIWDVTKTHIVYDKHATCYVMLTGGPPDETWEACADDAASVLMKAREDGLACGGFKPDDLQHRRGNFLAFACGVSFGGGQKRPGNLVQPENRIPIIRSLCSNQSIRRIAGFQSRCLATFAPRLFTYAQETLKKLFASNEYLKPNFSNSIYPTITFNCGPDTACVEHVDHGNAAHMLCAVTALGKYDHTKGGHLILYPLKKFFQFPPGSTMLIPSATIAHGNTPISKGEFRCSVTQYCPGGLLRWVEYGLRSVKSLLNEPGGATKRAKIDGPPGSRFEWALGLFSKLKELVSVDEKGEEDEEEDGHDGAVE